MTLFEQLKKRSARAGSFRVAATTVCIELGTSRLAAKTHLNCPLLLVGGALCKALPSRDGKAMLHVGLRLSVKHP
jgi:hypothetical protein